MALKKKPIDVDIVSPTQWQGAGVHEDEAFERQPRGTSRYALNFRPYCPKTGFRRLSRRAGMTQTVDAGGRIQNINHQVVAQAIDTSDVKGRTVHVAAVAGGTIKEITSWGDGSGSASSASGDSLDSSVPVVFSFPLGGYLWFCDGTDIVRWDPATNTASNTTTLSITGAPVGARLCCAWRGRAVFAGDVDEPHNWFMSAVDDPTDWDYAPVPAVETQAVAGNRSPAGQVPDAVNTLIPINDDKLLFGCDHSLYLMRGDPAAGGRIDLFDGHTGMSWGQPWCKDPSGGIYFHGSRGGIFYLSRNFQIKRISAGIESRLREVPLATTLVRLAYNDAEQGVHVFFSSTSDLSGSGNTHLFYDVRTESWWLDQISNDAYDIVAPHIVDGDGATDRVLLLGDPSGRVLHFDPDEEKDGGSYFNWEVWLGPISLGDNSHCMLDEIEAVLGDHDCIANWDVYTGETAEAAFNSSFLASGVWQARTRHTERACRLSGNRLYLVLSNRTHDTGNEYLTVERLTVVLRESGRPSYRLRR